MDGSTVPQPGVDRMVPVEGHAVVVGVTPDQPPLVALTALALARAVDAPAVHFAYADTSRYVVAEAPDGAVQHAPVDPDSADDTWQDVRDRLRAALTDVVGTGGPPWELHYLAGRPDRALTHLARAVDAGVLVVGTRAPGSAARVREFFEGSVAVHLAQHQHRPVLTVPLSVVDWKVGRNAWQ